MVDSALYIGSSFSALTCPGFDLLPKKVVVDLLASEVSILSVDDNAVFLFFAFDPIGKILLTALQFDDLERLALVHPLEGEANPLPLHGGELPLEVATILGGEGFIGRGIEGTVCKNLPDLLAAYLFTLLDGALEKITIRSAGRGCLYTGDEVQLTRLARLGDVRHIASDFLFL